MISDRYKNGALVYDGFDLHLAAARYVVTVSHCVYLLYRTIDADLYLALALTLSGYAQIHICRLAYAVFNLKGSVVLQLIGLFLDVEEHQHKTNAYQDSNEEQ